MVAFHFLFEKNFIKQQQQGNKIENGFKIIKLQFAIVEYKITKKNDVQY